MEFYAIGLAVAVILFIVIILSLNLKKKLEREREIIEFKEKIPKEKILKLEKELAALESACNSKFISKASYSKNKKRLERKIENLKSVQTKK